MITYTYNPGGQLLTKLQTKGAATLLETYTYRTLTLVITGIDELDPAATATLTINGLSLSAPGHAISLYDLRGARVAQGTGHVSAPRPGLYVVRVGSATTKVLLR